MATKKPTASIDKEEVTTVLHMPRLKRFNVWIVGDSPLICHAWSEHARREMFDKQLKTIKVQGREARDPIRDFINSLYDMGDGIYGFPVTALKKAMRESAHVNRGITKVSVFPSIFFNYDIVSVRPALASAKCNMPLVRIVAEKPVMREDMVRVGKGLNKTASLAYRGEFYPWAMNLTGRLNTAAISEEALSNLALWSGLEVGIGEWRTEKSGVMGSYHPATEEEARAWERFRSGDGPIPVPDNYREAA